MVAVDTVFQLQIAAMAGHHLQKKPTLPIRFFKTILEINLERLKIPDKFTRRYGGGLPNPVLIKPPDGTEWEMHWTKRNGEVWFEKGWKEFVENYSLDHGHLVVFKYNGTSQIDVIMLHQDALEIDYPFDVNDNTDQSDDESVQILDDQQHAENIGEKGKERSLSLNWPKQSRAKEVARNFESKNPFFTVTIKPVNLAGGRLWVPAMKDYINEKEEKYVKLEVGERSWDVKLLRSQNSSGCRLSSGWSMFAAEIELLPGDVCVFEFISVQDLVFKVHVFKNV
ncbi:hypothetical protein RJT34_25634 [Clitoria ternatea]|uniref:TF-B3 domain-containing protein n=1 Tax=Clitoria ternatea TaxID=43366 RepID=A0AAN9IK59_CLITE